MDKFYLSGSDWQLKEFIEEDWIWRNAEKRNTKDIRWWKAGAVPSSVTYDLWMAGEIQDPYFEKNSLSLEWIPQRTWIYRKKFSMPLEYKEKSLVLTCSGVDYEALFYLNDQYLGTHSSMFVPVSFEVAHLIDWEGENQISIVLQKAPDEKAQVSKTRYVKTHKSRMTYWWDFCPRMIHQGIWDDVYIEAYRIAKIEDVYVKSEVSDDFSGAALHYQIKVNSKEHVKVKVSLNTQVNGETVFQEQAEYTLSPGDNNIIFQKNIKNPQLWWPNGYGAQPIYTTEVNIWKKSEPQPHPKPLHSYQTSFGIRKIEFTANEGAESKAAAYTVKVNGKRIYINGWNWVPMDVCYGVKKEKKQKHLLTLAQNANVTMLRVWGGGLIEREDFYHLCDRLGIMVWQEFIQSSSGIEDKPSEEPEFLKLMKQEAEGIIPGKRNHPSLAVWCGGNELQKENRPVDDTEPVINVLKQAVGQLDGDRYFLPTSPSGRIFFNSIKNIRDDPEGLHDVHGPWEHQGLKEQYQLYNRGTSLLSSEFGVEGMTNYETLKKSVGTENIWPPDRDNPVYAHRGAWWINYDFVQKCFGNNIREIKTMIKCSQFLQYEGLRYAVESNRRRAFSNSGSLVWQFNEPYPNNYCTCAVDYYGETKAAYYGIAKAYSPLHITAELPGQSLAGMDDIVFKVYGHNSRPQESGILFLAKWMIFGSSGACFAGGGRKLTLERESSFGYEVVLNRKQLTEELISLNLYLENDRGELVAENRYLCTMSSDLTALTSLHKTELQVWKEYDLDNVKLHIKNKGAHLAAGIKLEMSKDPEQETYLYFDENYLWLMPGEQKEIHISRSGEPAAEVGIHISGFNIEESTLLFEEA